ncbi:lytic transglycosylase domain-containing protein [Ahrensia sp. R2A130]|uniref:lytic transglycosylase domain-containing protein n=1 Tax=Ahrensia sp. R2A130 TaxID=744979 RepID=UPI0018DE63B8|nr:transglycosylase SLT domain-containing protein [Ahrensia sp. R2A130]
MTPEERRAKRDEAKNVQTSLLPGVKWEKNAASAAIKPAAETKSKRQTPQKAMNSRYSKYSSIIRRHAKANGIPYRLAKAVVQVESNFKAKARGAAGEIGLMQIMPTTARYIGYKGKMGALYNPETNIKYGMKYLGKAHRLGGGSTCGTILKYNAGHGAKKMNKISRKYCARVKGILAKG